MGLKTRTTGRRTRIRARGAAVLCAAATVAATACGHTVSGTATSSKPSGPAASTPSSAQPDPGNFPTKPRAPLGAANTPFVGRLLDAQRMAGYVTGPWEVDPALIEAFPPQAVVIKNADALSIFLDKDDAAVAGRHDFVNGFHTARQIASQQRSLRNAVLRFADPAAASAAATELAQTELAKPVSGATRTAVPIPGHPDALTSSYPFTDNASHKERANVTSFTPHGPFVLVQIAQSFAGLDEAVGLVAGTLDLQIPLIDQFTPTPVADFPSLPRDPSGLLARTIPVSDKDETVNLNATFDRRGMLQFQSDSVKSAQLFGDTGMDLATAGKTTVYQASDPAGASKIVDEFIAEVSATGHPDDPVPGVPGSKCVNLSSAGVYCVAPAGRYAIESRTGQRTEVHQLVAAQYLMLTAT